MKQYLVIITSEHDFKFSIIVKSESKNEAILKVLQNEQNSKLKEREFKIIEVIEIHEDIKILN